MHIGHFKQKIYIHWSTALRVTRLKVVAQKSFSVKNDTWSQLWNCSDDLTDIKFCTLTLDRARTNQSPSCGAQLIGRGCSIVAIKTLYTLASANQNSMHIAGLWLETLYTLSQPVQKLYIHWAVSEPQWPCDRCLKKQHRKKKWHWFTAGVTKVKF